MVFKTLGFMHLLCAGLLAGEEFAICYGVRRSIGKLEPRAQIQVRQSLIRRLRVLVPVIFLLTVLSTVAFTALGGPGLSLPLRCAGLAALLLFISVTLGGTVPINKAVLVWDVDAPPESWQTQIDRWERLDTVRTWAAFAAFGLFLAAMLAG